MQIVEFIKETGRLENYYEKKYTTDQKQTIYEVLGNLSIEQYKNAIDVAFSKSKFLPKASELKEFSKCDEKQKNERFKQLYKNLDWCEIDLEEY